MIAQKKVSAIFRLLNMDENGDTEVASPERINHSSRPTQTHNTISDHTAVSRSAASTLVAMMPALKKLAADTKNKAVQHQIAALSEVVRMQLEGMNGAKRQSKKNLEKANKSKALNAWGKQQGVQWKVAGDMLKSMSLHFKNLAHNIASEVHSEECVISEQELTKASEDALLFAIREFDPDPLDSFEEFAQPIIRHCLDAAISAQYGDEPLDDEASYAIQIGTAGYRSVDLNKLTLHSSDEHRDAFMKWATEQHIPNTDYESAILGAGIHYGVWLQRWVIETKLPTKRTNDLGWRMRQAGAHTLVTKLREFNPIKHGDDFMEYAADDVIDKMKALKPSKVDTSESATNRREVSERDVRLLAWARKNKYVQQHAFATQGEMIRRHTAWMISIRDEMLGSSSLPPEDLQTGGYRLLKGLVRDFDPAQHGEDFAVYAEPYIRAGMELCLEQVENVIPEIADSEFFTFISFRT